MLDFAASVLRWIATGLKIACSKLPETVSTRGGGKARLGRNETELNNTPKARIFAGSSRAAITRPKQLRQNDLHEKARERCALPRIGALGAKEKNTLARHFGRAGIPLAGPWGL